MPETWVRSLGWEDPLEKGKATHSYILAWRIPWTWLTFTSHAYVWLSPLAVHLKLSHFVNRLYTNTSQMVLVVKNLPANAGEIRDTGSIPWLGRSPREGKGYPLQYSSLENSIQSMDSQRVKHDWVTFTLFSWTPKSMWMMTAAMKLKDTCSLEGKLWQT